MENLDFHMKGKRGQVKSNLMKEIQHLAKRLASLEQALQQTEERELTTTEINELNKEEDEKKIVLLETTLEEIQKTERSLRNELKALQSSKMMMMKSVGNMMGKSNHPNPKPKPKLSHSNSEEYDDWVKERETYYELFPPPIRLFSLKDLKGLGRCPRYPDDQDNMKYIELTEDVYHRNMIVFVSHRWYRRDHPDDADENGNKYKLMCEGIEKTMKEYGPGFDEESCLIWFDYGSLNQDDCPNAELQHLHRIVSLSDIIFTPHYDDTSVIPNSYNTIYHDYHSELWNGDKVRGYLYRPWCRVEMMYATHRHIVKSTEEKRAKFREGIRAIHDLDRRPHLLYVSSERVLQVLHPLVGKLEKQLDPLKVIENGRVEDEKKFKRLMDPTTLPRKQILIGYVGDKDSEGRAHGKGRKIDELGNVYEGDWKAGVLAGKGKFIFANGDVYEGDFNAGVKEGKGKYTSANGDVYEGDFKANIEEGKGKLIFANGDKYEGDFKAGVREGKGKLIFANGDSHEGDWKADRREGKGKLIFVNGAVYEGDFKADRRAGTGKLLFANGNVYEGDWKENRREGKGKLIFTNGDVYEGDWKADRREGQGKLLFANGNVYEGDFKANVREGKGKLIFTNGNVYEGEFNADRREGKGKLLFAVGDVYEGDWEANVREGKGKLIFANGDEYEGNWKAGVREGKGKMMFASGAVREGDWKSDRFLG